MDTRMHARVVPPSRRHLGRQRDLAGARASIAVEHEAAIAHVHVALLEVLVPERDPQQACRRPRLVRHEEPVGLGPPVAGTQRSDLGGAPCTDCTR